VSRSVKPITPISGHKHIDLIHPQTNSFLFSVVGEQDRPKDPGLLLQRKLPLADLGRDYDRGVRPRRVLNRPNEICARELRLGNAVTDNVEAKVVLEQKGNMQVVVPRHRQQGDVNREESDHVRRVGNILLDLQVKECVSAKFVQ
jgi:hypothetical protein